MPRLASSSEAIASADWIAEVPVFPWPMCRKSLVFFTALPQNLFILAFPWTFLFALCRDNLSLVWICSVGQIFWGRWLFGFSGLPRASYSYWGSEVCFVVTAGLSWSSGWGCEGWFRFCHLKPELLRMASQAKPWTRMRTVLLIILTRFLLSKLALRLLSVTKCWVIAQEGERYCWTCFSQAWFWSCCDVWLFQIAI